MMESQLGYPIAYFAWNCWSSSLESREGLVRKLCSALHSSWESADSLPVPSRLLGAAAAQFLKPCLAFPSQSHFCMMDRTELRVGVLPRDAGSFLRVVFVLVLCRLA
jgi:hypothetical protein